MRQEINSKLRKLLNEHFNTSELRNLSFDLGIDYEMLQNESKGDFTRELITYCERHGLIKRLIQIILELRPNISLVGKLIDATVMEISFKHGLKGPGVDALVQFKFGEAEDNYAWIKLSTSEADSIIRIARSIEQQLLKGEMPIPNKAKLPKDFQD